MERSIRRKPVNGSMSLQTGPQTTKLEVPSTKSKQIGKLPKLIFTLGIISGLVVIAAIKLPKLKSLSLHLHPLPKLQTSDEVADLAFTPDGKMLISSGNFIRLRSTKTGEVLRTFNGPDAPYSSLAISPDGQTGLITSWKSSDTPSIVTEWDLASGQLLRSRNLNCEDGINPRVAYDPNGRRYATLCGDRPQRISLWKSNDELAISHELPAPLIADNIAFSPDGRYLAIAGVYFGDLISKSSRHFVSMYDTQTEHLTAPFVEDSDGAARTVVAFSPDGRILALGEGGRTIALVDASTGKLLRKLTQDDPPADGVSKPGTHPETNVLSIQPDSSVFSIAISPDGQILASASLGSSIRVWDIANARLLQTLKANTDSVDAVAFSPDGKVLASGGKRSIQLWDVTQFHRVGEALKPQILNAEDIELHPQQSDQPSSPEQILATDRTTSVDVTVLRWVPQQITISSWTPQLYVRNNSDSPISNVTIDVRAYDESGTMEDVGSAIISSIPAHTTAISNCCLNLLSGAKRLELGTPTFTR